MTQQKTALVIMAAGIGSRYGGGIKQLAQVGPGGEIILDYSVYDAIEAGFDKIVLVIRHDIEKDFREVLGDRLAHACAQHGVSLCYAFQELQDLPDGLTLPAGRTKPWGTGQAILAAASILEEPFAVINADDYYGKKAFRLLHSFLCEAQPADTACMAGFILKNTLSDNGTVTRGLCRVNDEGWLTGIEETRNILKTASGAEANGRALDINGHVSMNMWGLSASILPVLRESFVQFLKAVPEGDLKAEFLLPEFIGKLLKEGRIRVKVLATEDNWFGVTYQEDKAAVQEAFRRLTDEGVYPEVLFP